MVWPPDIQDRTRGRKIIRGAARRSGHVGDVDIAKIDLVPSVAGRHHIVYIVSVQPRLVQTSVQSLAGDFGQAKPGRLEAAGQQFVLVIQQHSLGVRGADIDPGDDGHGATSMGWR